MEIPCTSATTAVIVHARGALVTRRVVVPADLPDGDVAIVVRDVTPLLEAGSVRASATGRRVVSVAAALHVPEAGPAAGPASLRVRDLERRLARLAEQRQALEARKDALLEVQPAPRLRAADAPGSSGRVDDARAAGALLERLAADLDARVVDLDREVADAERDLAAARLAHAQAATSERTGAGHPTAHLVVHLSGTGDPGAVEVTYAVAAARFWPCCTLALGADPEPATLAIEAFVAQRTGEDWSGVRLACSTADLTWDARLPELPALRLGRAQPQSRRAWRPAPDGLDLLFASWDLALSDGLAREAEAIATPEGRAEAPPAGPPQAIQERVAFRRAVSAAEVALADEEEPTRGPTASQAVPDGPPLDAGVRARAFLPVRLARSHAAPKAGAGAAAAAFEPQAFAPPPAPPAGIEPGDAYLDFDALVLAAPGDPARRGRLVREERPIPQADDGPAAIEALASPLPGLVDPREARGAFDSRYVADGPLDVASDGRPRRLRLAGLPVAPDVRFRAVPREAPEVYRLARLRNPFPVPLLPGVVEVLRGGSLVAASPVGAVDVGGSVEVGLGVEERLRVARNVRAEEGSHGVLGGSVAVLHEVAIDLRSSLGFPATVEVRERLPVSDDGEIEVKRLSARPEPERYDQADLGAPVRGGLSWTVEVPAGGQARIEWSYRLAFPASDEIVGGNRRD